MAYIDKHCGICYTGRRAIAQNLQLTPKNSMSERTPEGSLKDMFRPKNAGGPAKEEISRMEREVEAENESIEETCDKLLQDPEAFSGFMREQILPLIKTLNMELRFIKLRNDQGSLDSVANSDYLFANVKNRLQQFEGKE